MTTSVPRNNEELVKHYGRFVAEKVGHLNKTKANFADILQSVWVRLLEADIVTKFHARYAEGRPSALNTEEVCLHLAISVDSWTEAQAAYRAGVGAIQWMPTPVAGDPTSLDALWATDDVERYEATAAQHHEKVGESEGLIPRPTDAQFRTYLHQCLHNAFANWCRTHSRRASQEHLADMCVPRHLVEQHKTDENYDTDLFDFVTDTQSPARRMASLVEARQAVEALRLGGRQSEFVELLQDGYTAKEAARKLRLSQSTVYRIERVLAV